MARRRKPGLLGVMLLGAFYYFVPLPVGYALVSNSLRCLHFEGCPGRPKPTQLQAARTAAMLYMADNPRKCPTVEALVEERYLGEWNADGIEVSCSEGDVEVFGPQGPPPPPVPVDRTFKRVACGVLAVGVEIWLLPIRAFHWSWKTAAGWFV